MDVVYDVGRLAEEQQREGEAWNEFLRVPDLSVGLYQLKAGAPDPQTPHGEDEIYYVLAGRARLVVDGTWHDVVPGALLFVPAGAEHHFAGIAEDLTLLVAFGPAEGTRPARLAPPA
jgi:quercetin dioxygenase-like cupin family protein